MGRSSERKSGFVADLIPKLAGLVKVYASSIGIMDLLAAESRITIELFSKSVLLCFEVLALNFVTGKVLQFSFVETA